MKNLINYGALINMILPNDIKIAVAIPVFNEEFFVEQSVKNCLDVGYDYVVYLDDCSTDNTYEKLLMCTKDYKHIKVLKNEKNSVLNSSMGRWEYSAIECSKSNPDWIMVRAADECLSSKAFRDGDNLLRKSLVKLMESNISLAVFSYVDLWRSKWWYRVDGFWGRRTSVNGWRNNIGWKFSYTPGIHRGAHVPNSFDRSKKITTGSISSNKDIVVLHYGMASHELLLRKLKYTLDISKAIGSKAHGVPIKIPSPSLWHKFNGYKAAYELDAKLVKVEQRWFQEQVLDVPKPEFIPLTSLLQEYDAKIAATYDELFKKQFKGN